EALAATDTAKLTDLYAKAQKLVWEDAPWIFLGSDQVIAGEKTYVSGIYLAPDGKLDVTKAKLS
ncbi:MAG TPA: glutathione ABC transporter substrate-binding protein, partial [Ruminococcaceae bacterium]|nr:glutathione ABC transporter substrate-binding protein [Oscillospiraceae bacterium]